MRIILQWVFVSLGMLGVSYAFPDFLSISPWWVVLIAGAAYMFIQTIVKPVVTILTLPINLLTLGLFGVVINAVLFWSLSFIVEGFDVSGFVAAVITSFVMSVIYWLVKKIFKD